MEITFTNYGGKVVSLMVPGKNGDLLDVVTGYNSIETYLNSGEIYFGAAIGPYGNRIANGKFTIEGVEYELVQNIVSNSLRGGPDGFHLVVWDANQTDNDTLELSYFSKHMEEGFPGKLNVKMIYKLAKNNEILLEYYATSDKTTVCNLTNHTCLNLSALVSQPKIS